MNFYIQKSPRTQISCIGKAKHNNNNNNIKSVNKIRFKSAKRKKNLPSKLTLKKYCSMDALEDLIATD